MNYLHRFLQLRVPMSWILAFLAFPVGLYFMLIGVNKSPQDTFHLVWMYAGFLLILAGIVGLAVLVYRAVRPRALSLFQRLRVRH